MSIKFVGREGELEFLEEEYNREGFRFIPIYGRRRVGKTELIVRFIKNKKAIYYLADKSNENLQIESFKNIASEVLNDDLMKMFNFRKWDDMLKYISDNIKDSEEKLVIVIDELPYLIAVNKSLPSMLQKVVDLYFMDKNIFLILCGSSVSMMEREVLAYRAPLYGRRTGQILLKPFRFREALKMLSGKSIEEAIMIYSVSGGVPYYMSILNKNMKVQTLIKEKIIKKNEFLNVEAEFLLKEEFRTPYVYFSILKALALGKNKLNEISTYVNEPATSVPKYLETLERLGYVGRDIPVLDNPLKSKKSLYYISDSYMSFWFRFVYPYKSYIEQENYDVVLRVLRNEFNHFVSRTFEELCRQFLFFYKIMDFNKIGRQWGKIPYAEKGKNVYEIDVLAVNEDKREILFGECKWKDNVDAEKVFEELREKAKYVKWNVGNRKEKYVIFAKSFKNREVEGVELVDLEMLEKYFG